MDFNEKTISSDVLYNGKILNLRVDRVELPGGKVTSREVVEHGGAVAVVPLNEKGEVIMVRQYRHPAGRVLLEVPAGKIERSEDPAACAARELREETGFSAGGMEFLFSFYTTPGFTTEKLYLYLARGLEYRGGLPDEDELIEVQPVLLGRALEMVDRGEICDAKSIIGILAAKRALDREE